MFSDNRRQHDLHEPANHITPRRTEHPHTATGVRVQVLLEAVQEKRPLQDTSAHTHWDQVVLLPGMWKRSETFTTLLARAFSV